MATLKIEAKPSKDLRRYKLAIDKKRVTMKADNTGAFDVRGECGDGSEHRFSFSLFGPAGSKLKVKITCGDKTEVQLDELEVHPEGEPLAAGWLDFKL